MEEYKLLAPTNNIALEGELVDLDLDLEGAISPDPSNLNIKKPISIEIGPSKLEPYESSSYSKLDEPLPDKPINPVIPIFIPKPIEVIASNQPITNEPLNNSNLISEGDKMQLDYYKHLAKTSSYILSFVYKARKRVISKDSTPTTYKQVLILPRDEHRVFYNAKTCHFIVTYIDDCLFIGPDIGYITDLKKQLNEWLSRSLNRPTKLHLNAAKNLLKYLDSTKDYSICFSYNGNTLADLGPKLSNSSNTTTKLSRDLYSKEGPRPLTTSSTTIVDSRNGKGSSRTSIINSSLVPIGLSDSDFIGDKATSKSTYGYLYQLAGTGNRAIGLSSTNSNSNSSNSNNTPAPTPAKPAKITPAIRRAAACKAKRRKKLAKKEGLQRSKRTASSNAGRYTTNSGLTADKDNNNAHNRAYMPPADTEEEEEGGSGNNNGVNSSTSNSADKGKGSSTRKRSESALRCKDTLLYKQQRVTSYPYGPSGILYADIYIYYI
ncbi:hypothetical protein P8C59_007669 [Phyllachora maydis]|uniref:Uncharacterized protein n=1 Tax=Phyllachora maydis TaxID=1825666 RepID=A0AAD9MIL5_9PEZI|nr:hypothetical protein P8C59_007669 [Phyllachora maydis]